MNWYMIARLDGTKTMECTDPHEPPAKILLESAADFLGYLIPVVVTDRGLFALTSAGWGRVEQWEPGDVPQELLAETASR